MNNVTKTSINLLIFLYKYSIIDLHDLDILIFQFNWDNEKFVFNGFDLNDPHNLAGSNLKNSILKIAREKPELLKLAIKFLFEENLLDFKLIKSNQGHNYTNISLTSEGIKAIEGTVDKNYRSRFENHFHFSLVGKVTIESFIKTRLGFLNL